MKAVTSAFEFKLFMTNARNLEFDTESYRKVDFEAYSQTLSDQYQNGVITLNEFRTKIGLPKVKEEYANKNRVSLNQVNAEIVDEYQKATMDNRLKGGENNG